MWSFLALATVGYFYGQTEAGRIDACLDNGGAWNYDEGRCEGERTR